MSTVETLLIEEKGHVARHHDRLCLSALDAPPSSRRPHHPSQLESHRQRMRTIQDERTDEGGGRLPRSRCGPAKSLTLASWATRPLGSDR